MGYRIVKKNYDDMLSRFHLIPERHGQTDRQTDGQTDSFSMSISRVSMLIDARQKPLHTHTVTHTHTILT